MKRILIALISFLLLTSLASAATLQVGSTAKYKTIQSAVNAAKTGDTIYVAAGTYKELVKVNNKDLIFQGQKVGNTYKYPSVYGFSFGWTDVPGEVGSGDVNGFKITRDGIDYGVVGGNTVRNNYFYNCGVTISGLSCSGNTIMNNKFSGNYNYGGVYLYESLDNVITGNTFSKATIGLSLGDFVTCTSLTKNTFTGCKVAVQVYGGIPDYLIGNTYKNNKVNIKIVPVA